MTELPLPEKLKKDLMRTRWRQLRVHMRRDALILVSSELSLLDVGLALAEDDSAQVQTWIEDKSIQKPTPDQLQAWEKELEQPFWMLIVQPFVLFQDTPLARYPLPQAQSLDV